MLLIKKNDQVKVMSGRDRGKTGRVLEVDLARNRVLVEHIQVVKRHTRPNPQKNVKGGIVERESPIHRVQCDAALPHLRSHPRAAAKIAGWKKGPNLPKMRQYAGPVTGSRQPGNAG